MNTYFEHNMSIIDNSIRSLDSTEFLHLVGDSKEVLQGGGKIIVSGLGKNVPVCDKFVGSMVSMGLNASFMNTNSAVHGDIGMVKDNDLVIVLTKSGETVESIYLVSLLKKRKAKIWLISFQAESTLSRELENHIVLSLESEGDIWNIMPVNSTVVNLLVLHGLAMELAKEMNVQLSDFKKNHPGGAIGKVLSSGE